MSHANGCVSDPAGPHRCSYFGGCFLQVQMLAAAALGASVALKKMRKSDAATIFDWDIAVAHREQALLTRPRPAPASSGSHSAPSLTLIQTALGLLPVCRLPCCSGVITATVYSVSPSVTHDTRADGGSCIQHPDGSRCSRTELK